MKSIIWKELRENWKWAALGLAGLLLAELYSLSTGSRSSHGDNIGLLGSTFLLVTSFGCSLVGAALGTLQILPERRRDQWAALLHRPVCRGTIIAGKILTGVGLYLAAVGIPFLASVVFVSLPRQFAAPQLPVFLIPGASDILLGLAFYFGAVIICLINGKWYGLKLLVMLSLALTFFAHTCTIDTPGLVSLLFIGASAYSAWAIIRSNGEATRIALPRRLALIAILLWGAQAALLAVLYIVVVTSPVPALGPYSSFSVRQSGKIVIQTSMPDGTNQFTDINGRPLSDQSDKSDPPLTWSYLTLDTPTDSQYRMGWHPGVLRLTTRGYMEPLRSRNEVEV